LRNHTSVERKPGLRECSTKQPCIRFLGGRKNGRLQATEAIIVILNTATHSLTDFLTENLPFQRQQQVTKTDELLISMPSAHIAQHGALIADHMLSVQIHTKQLKEYAMKCLIKFSIFYGSKRMRHWNADIADRKAHD
jgi:hypothetical protein